MDAEVSYVTPEQALELASLPRRGQAFYADLRAEGSSHDDALRDAVYSYGRRV